MSNWVYLYPLSFIYLFYLILYYTIIIVIIIILLYSWQFVIT